MRMLNTYHDGRGFTLIELLIVVAIIGILAAIAFPMLSVFRMRAYNSSACSDIRNVKTAEESLNAVFQTYGISEGSALAPVLVAAATGGSGPGAASAGPAPAAQWTIPGVLLTGPKQSGGACAIGIRISSGVTVVADTLPVVPPASSALSYTAYAKHRNGDRVFVIEAESNTIFFVQNSTAAFVGQTLQAGGAPATVPAVSPATDISAAIPGGGNPYLNWSPM